MEQKVLSVSSQKCHVNNDFFLLKNCSIHDWNCNVNKAGYNSLKHSQLSFEDSTIKLPRNTVFLNADSQEQLIFCADAALLSYSDQ